MLLARGLVAKARGFKFKLDAAAIDALSEPKPVWLSNTLIDGAADEVPPVEADHGRIHPPISRIDAKPDAPPDRLRPHAKSRGGFKFERKHHLTTLERMVRWQEIAYD
jgi:hypothetical protein